MEHLVVDGSDDASFHQRGDVGVVPATSFQVCTPTQHGKRTIIDFERDVLGPRRQNCHSLGE